MAGRSEGGQSPGKRAPGKGAAKGPARRTPATSAEKAAGKRPRVTAAERRRRILEAAASVFAEHGYAGARTRAIADAGGVNEALVYRHFPSKEKLYRAVLESCMQDQDIDGFLDGLPRDDPPQEIFARVATRILEVGRANPTIHRLLIGASMAGTPETQAAYVSWRMPFVEYLEELIRAGIEAGTFRPVDPRLSARAFVGMVMDCVISCDLWETLGQDTITSSDLVHNNVPTYVRGLLADPPRLPDSQTPNRGSRREEDERR